METIPVATHTRTELIDITAEVQTAARKHKWQDGVLTLFVPHTTAGIFINENADPSVQADILRQLEKLAPPDAPMLTSDSPSRPTGGAPRIPAGHRDGHYSHSEGNSDGHIKSTLTGCSLNIIVENGTLVLGTWQGIYFAEFDGPRSRKLYLKFMSSS